MPDAHLPPAHAWWILTHLGASSLQLPALLLVLGGMWESGARDVAKRYLLRLVIAVGITVISKCLFFGWGIGIAALDFTGVSGHTLLATSILPVLLRGIPWPALQARGGGAALGWLLALVVGVSRLAVHAHSLSEVVAGWILGAAVSWPTVRQLAPLALSHWASKVAPLVLLLALNTSTATYLPTHDIEVRLAMLVSGQGKPFSRHQLHAGPKPAAPTSSISPTRP